MKWPILLLILAFAGCAAQPKMLWIRTDGQPMRGNPVLFEQYRIDITICDGEGSKADLSAGADNPRRFREVPVIFEGCMAQRGYIRVLESELETRAAIFRSTKK